jgi:crossover junction endodeoxyribonuclease RuvC
VIVIGIDNGLDGGIVAIASDGLLISSVTPTLGTGKRSYDVQHMADTLRDVVDANAGGDCMAFLERAQAMPGQGVSSMFSIGFGFGIWQGLLTALRVPFEIVSPRKWQNEMFVGINRTDTKAASALVAQRLRPDVDWRASPRCRKPHDGLTDAYCIAEYGRRNFASFVPMLAG